MRRLLLIPIFAFGLCAHAQGGFFGSMNSPVSLTPATGDTRTVTEPIFPGTICSKFKATKYIVKTTAVNLDPFNSTCGSSGGTFGTLGCTGGTDYQPSSSSSGYVPSEGTDNTALLAAINACPSGQAVELIPGDLGQLGYVLKPMAIPTGKNITTDPGTHMFASRVLTDYGGTNCGIVTSSSSHNCNPWITAGGTSGVGIYGYGTWDGRGPDAWTTSPTQSFYTNRLQAYCNQRGGASHGSPACTPNGAGGNSYGPTAFNLIGANNFTWYKGTIMNSGDFGINYKNSTNGTFWGLKVLSPHEVSNTDGIDPLDSTNVTITHSFISVGDNHMAVKSTGSGAKNITFSFNQTGAGIGVVVGADTSGGVSNVLVTDLVQNGNRFNDQSCGIQIGSDSAQGGLVDKVTFQNVCQVNEDKAIRVYSNYGGKTGSLTPVYIPVLIRNFHALASTAPYTTGKSGSWTFQGLANFPLLLQLDNVTMDGSNEGIETQGSATNDRYATVYLGPRQVPTSVVNQLTLTNGPGVSVLDAAGSSTPYACTTSMWLPLIGELNLKSPAANISQSYTGAGAVTLQAVLRPTTAISTKESPEPTASVQFYEGVTLLGSAALTGDGTLASLTLTPTTGTHTYTAKYPGDSHYSAYTFGSVTVVAP